jgi:hypothetical protein
VEGARPLGTDVHELLLTDWTCFQRFGGDRERSRFREQSHVK